jgi:Na+-transporting NADH:ubiquinone oxidoreductase subunit NqrC
MNTIIIIIIVIVFISITIFIGIYYKNKKNNDAKKLHDKYKNNSEFVILHKFTTALKNGTRSDYPDRSNTIMNNYTKIFNKLNRENRIKLIEDIEKQALESKQHYKNLANVDERLSKIIQKNQKENNARRTQRSKISSKAIVKKNWNISEDYQNSYHNL